MNVIQVDLDEVNRLVSSLMDLHYSGKDWIEFNAALARLQKHIAEMNTNRDEAAD